MNPRRRKSNESSARVIWGMAIVVLCLVGIANGVLDIANESALQSRGQVADAIVTDTATKSRYIVFASYRLQYRFQVGEHRFWHDGSILRNLYSLMQKPDRPPKEYWAETTQVDWDHGSRSKRVKVLYLPNDPWINRPVAAEDLALSPLLARILETGLLVVLLVVGASILFSAFA